jgi:hypothetical protein
MPRRSQGRPSWVATTGCGALALSLVWALPGQAAELRPAQLPSVQVPSVQVPSVPLPSVPSLPSPPPAPAPQLPAPQLPAPSPAPAPAPSLPQLPSGSPGTSPAAPQAPGVSSPSLADGTVSSLSSSGGGNGAGGTGGSAASGAPGMPGSNGRASSLRRRATLAANDPRLRRRDGVDGTGFRSRGELVRALRGCIDELPRMQRVVLVLRYGVGSVDSRSRGATARDLGTSRQRVAVLERRGVRTLARTSRSTGCEHTGLGPSAVDDVFAVIVTSFVSDALAPAAILPGDPGAERDTSGVKAAHQSGTAGGGEDDDAPPVAASTLPLTDGQASPDDRIALLLLLAAVGSAAFLARGLLRALR